MLRARIHPKVGNGVLAFINLFGCRLDPDFYQATIKACALLKGFHSLPDSDDWAAGEIVKYGTYNSVMALKGGVTTLPAI